MVDEVDARPRLAVTRYSIINYHRDLRRLRRSLLSIQRKIDDSFPGDTFNPEGSGYVQVHEHDPSDHPYHSRRFSENSFPPASEANTGSGASGYNAGYLAGLVRPNAAILDAGPSRGDTQFQIRTIVAVSSTTTTTATTKGTHGPHDLCWHWLGCLVARHSWVGRLAVTSWIRTGWNLTSPLSGRPGTTVPITSIRCSRLRAAIQKDSLLVIFYLSVTTSSNLVLRIALYTDRGHRIWGNSRFCSARTVDGTCRPEQQMFSENQPVHQYGWATEHGSASANGIAQRSTSVRI